MTRDLHDCNVAVVGASSGLGRGFALRAIRAGASVTVAARRRELLESLVAEAGGGVPVSVDLLDEDAPSTIAAAVRAETPQLDVLLISVGSASLRRLEHTTSEDWRGAFETNVIGISRTLAGLLDLLTPVSVVVIVSSETAVSPRSHLGAYGSSKAALEHSIEQWREEHPWLRLTTVSLGATVPTEFGSQFDPLTTTEALEAWTLAGRHQLSFMATDEVCDVLRDVVVALLGAPSVGLHRLVLRSPSPPVNDPAIALDVANELPRS
jgi:NAD(P)-dependent dehydrogenase (short-subunit alcohol dehydrogenase family)